MNSFICKLKTFYLLQSRNIHFFQSIIIYIIVCYLNSMNTSFCINIDSDLVVEVKSITSFKLENSENSNFINVVSDFISFVDQYVNKLYDGKHSFALSAESSTNSSSRLISLSELLQKSFYGNSGEDGEFPQKKFQELMRGHYLEGNKNEEIIHLYFLYWFKNITPALKDMTPSVFLDYWAQNHTKIFDTIFT